MGKKYGSKIPRKKAIWEYKIHADKERGPNKISFSAVEALHYARKYSMAGNNKRLKIAATFLDSSKTIVFDNCRDFDYFTKTIVESTGERIVGIRRR